MRVTKIVANRRFLRSEEPPARVYRDWTVAPPRSLVGQIGHIFGLPWPLVRVIAGVMFLGLPAAFALLYLFVHERSIFWEVEAGCAIFAAVLYLAAINDKHFR